MFLYWQMVLQTAGTSVLFRWLKLKQLTKTTLAGAVHSPAAVNSIMCRWNIWVVYQIWWAIQRSTTKSLLQINSVSSEWCVRHTAKWLLLGVLLFCCLALFAFSANLSRVYSMLLLILITVYILCIHLSYVYILLKCTSSFQLGPIGHSYTLSHINWRIYLSTDSSTLSKRLLSVYL